MIEHSAGDPDGEREVAPADLVAIAESLVHAGRPEEGEQLLRQVLASVAHIQGALGRLILERGDLEAGLLLLRTANWIRPDEAVAEVLNSARWALPRVGEPGLNPAPERLDSDRPEALTMLGSLLTHFGRPLEAVPPLSKAVILAPKHGQACAALGVALQRVGRHSEAISAFEQALGIQDSLVTRSNLAMSCLELGYTTKARAAVAPMPKNVTTSSCFWLATLADPTYDSLALFEEHVALGSWLTSKAPMVRAPYSNDRSAGRRLKVGYVSPDFRRHAVGYFMEPLLEAHAPDAVEVFAYYNGKLSDETTTALRKAVPNWRDVAGLSDEWLDWQIRNDQIDILIDLAGYTSGERMALFARKPAPIQMAYLGYPHSRGLDTIDYFITDAWCDPAHQTEMLYSETLLRPFSSFLCYSPPKEAPPVVDRTQAVPVTFGCFAKYARLNEASVRVWAEVLGRLPAARILIKNDLMVDDAARARLLGWFEKAGIPGERVVLAPHDGALEDHLAHYAEIDVALDTFPYSGTTMTCEALWMGVPVVTQGGATHASRVTTSILNNVGLGHLATETPQQLVDACVALGRNRGDLRALRNSLRDRMSRSAVRDSIALARGLEAVYRAAWRRWLLDVDR